MQEDFEIISKEHIFIDKYKKNYRPCNSVSLCTYQKIKTRDDFILNHLILYYWNI